MTPAIRNDSHTAAPATAPAAPSSAKIPAPTIAPTPMNAACRTFKCLGASSGAFTSSAIAHPSVWRRRLPSSAPAPDLETVSHNGPRAGAVGRHPRQVIPLLLVTLYSLARSYRPRSGHNHKP